MSLKRRGPLQDDGISSTGGGELERAERLKRLPNLNHRDTADTAMKNALVTIPREMERKKRVDQSTVALMLPVIPFSCCTHCARWLAASCICSFGIFF